MSLALVQSDSSDVRRELARLEVAAKKLFNKDKIFTPKPLWQLIGLYTISIFLGDKYEKRKNY